MLARVKRTIFGNITTIEGFILLDDSNKKVIVDKDEDVESWSDCLVTFDEGTIEYFIAGKWVAEEDLDNIIKDI